MVASKVLRFSLAAAAVASTLLAGLTSALAATGPGICSNNKALACSSNSNCGAGNTCFLPTAGGQTLSNQVCMQDAAGQGLNCNANDVNLAATTNLSFTPCHFPGDTTTISFVAQFDLTAQARYDIGVWVAEDGGDALTGSCSATDFPTSPNPPWLNLDTTTDTCGDIDASHNPLYSSIQSITAACEDTNGDGNLDIAVCLSWQQPGSNQLCTSPVQAFPGSPSKCRCQTVPGITIPVPAVIKVVKQTLPDGDPTSFPFTMTSNVTSTQTFGLADGQEYDSGPLPLGTYAVGENVPAGWTLTGATCASDQPNHPQSPGNIVLHNGETVTCTFNDRNNCYGVTCAPADQCHDAPTCNTQGQCVYTEKSDGTACTDGDACTQNDTCQAGTCVGGASTVCAAGDTCHDAGVCNTQTGQCQYASKPNGTSCSDGNACTQTDTCQSGACTGSNPVTCAASDQCHDPGICNASTGQCSNPSKANGTTCGDGNACTRSDTCQAGVCTGSNPVTCGASDQCHDTGVCNPSTGQCSNPPKANGTTCGDGNACTQDDTCQGGVCTGADPVICTASDQCHDVGTCSAATGQCSNPPKANGSVCNDGNACTQTDACQAGMCTGSNAVVCGTPDQCHDPGTCDPTSGVCSNPPKTDGTACNNPGNLCNQTNTCQAGLCSGSSPVVCAPPDECHNPGTCNAGTGTCTYTTKPNGTACNDDNACTQTDTCQAGTCTGGNPVGCAASDQCHVAGQCDTLTGQCTNPTKPNGTTCNDGSPCTQDDTCIAGVCTGADPVVCAASDQCHVAGTCDPTSGVCSNPPKANGSACNDGNACTQTDACQGGLCTGGNPVLCTASDQCHDAGLCDTITGACSNPPMPNGTDCDDGNGCTQLDTCVAGSCTGSDPVVCSPLDQCHAAGSCNPATGACSDPSKADGSPCTDNDGCTLDDVCNGGICRPGADKDCADNTVCTDDRCASPSGTCVHAPISRPCDDANPCTTNDFCTAGACVGGQPPDCDDGNDCTTDSCSGAFVGGCFHLDNTEPCDDGNPCSVGDTCSGGGCQPGQGSRGCDDGNPCTDDSCDPVAGCVNTPNNAACNDNDACTSGDTCSGGRCAGTSTTVCDDGNPCTTDSCDPVHGCSHPNNADSCNDSNACTTGDTCSGGRCVGTTQSCDDGNACTSDSCDTFAGCQHQYTCPCDPAHDNCSDHNVCNGVEQCGADGHCHVVTPAPSCDDGNVCTDDACDAVNGCVHPNNTAPCNDNDACTTTDRCSGGRCVGTGQPNCNDSNVCTDDSCNAASGCVHLPNSTESCNDNDICTTTDVCLSGQCTGGGQPSCDDGNVCTTDRCVSTAPGGCVHDPNTIPCDDHDPCTVNDVCANGQCTTQPRNCSDGDDCTQDGCDVVNGQPNCRHTNCNDLTPKCAGEPQCIPSNCGNHQLDPGETCDPPDDTLIPGVVPPQVRCRNDCTSCGDGVTQVGDAESCDDGNQISGCDPARPTVPLDFCQNNCTEPICHDPAKITFGRVPKFKVHGLMATEEQIDFTSMPFVLQLSNVYGQPLYRSSLEDGSLIGVPEIGTYKYTNKLARVNGGIGKIRMRHLRNGYRVTVLAYGDFTSATDHMVTHVFTDPKEWTVVATWIQTSSGWRFQNPE